MGNAPVVNQQHVVAIFAGRSDKQAVLAEAFASLGVQTVTLKSSEELHHVLNHQRVDALVIEQKLNGFLTGLEILERLREQLLRPVTILIGELSSEERERAAKLKIDQVATWSVGVDVICQNVRASLACALISGLNIPAGARQVVQSAGFIRPMPQLVVRLAEYLRDDNASIADLARDISTDSGITAELLRITNSAALGLRNRVEKVADAVTLLGIRRTAALIIAASINNIQSKLQKDLTEDVVQWYRMRSVLTASGAAAFTRLSNQISRDNAHTLGLLQDLGILVMAQAYGQSYLNLVDRYRNVAQLQLDTCERQEFSFTHADVSAALLQKWELPVSMVRLVLDHHQVRNDGEYSPLERNLLQVMRVGEAIAHMRERPSPQRNEHVQQQLRNYPTANAGTIRSCLSDAIATAMEMGQLFNTPIPAGTNWDDLLVEINRKIDPNAPVPDAAAEVPPAIVPPEEEIGGPILVLVIDDEPAVAKLVRLYLHPENVAVEHWSGPRDFSELPPGVAAVLCDVHLAGGVDGIQYICDLRQRGFAGPVLILSGDRSRETVMSSIRASVNDYICKPFNKQILVERLTRAGALPAPTTANSAS